MMKMPALFIAHGSPLNALANNDYTQMLHALGQQLPTPRAILVISAHWQTMGTQVTGMTRPRTIHDFGGFPAELYAQQYPAEGSPDLAIQIQQLIPQVKIDQNWGLDHGSWTVLKFLYPAANIPVLQLSLDIHLSTQEHYQLAQKLQVLREQGVLIIGSGNLIHNLRLLQWRQINATPYPWAVSFEQQVRQYLDKRNHEALINYLQMGEAAHLAVPTDEHYLPLLYIIALQHTEEKVEYLYSGFEYAALSMLSFKI